MQAPWEHWTRRELAQLAVAGTSAWAARAQTIPPAGSAPGLTRRVAEFVVETCYADLPQPLIELGRKSILDGIGLALVGSVAKSGLITRSYLETLAVGPGAATEIGSTLKSAPRFAAFANGVGIHADDYDDTQLSAAPDRVYGLLTHPTAPCLSAALAVAEQRHLSGRDLILAYHLGVEVETKIAEAIAPRHYQDGFHSTGTCGTMASAAAAAKLTGANAAACARTLGMAGQPVRRPARKLPGVSIKPFPSGSLTHPAMSELLRLLRAHQIKPDQVEALDVGTNRNVPTALIHHQPQDALEAKFNMEFCMAALLVYGRAGLNEFTDEVVRRPEIQAMIRRVHFSVHPEAEKAGCDKMTSILQIHLKDGRTFSGRADFAKGSPSDPMSYDEVAAKFQDCARFAKWPAAKADAIVQTVRRLEDLANVRTLSALCAV